MFDFILINVYTCIMIIYMHGYNVIVLCFKFLSYIFFIMIAFMLYFDCLFWYLCVIVNDILFCIFFILIALKFSESQRLHWNINLSHWLRLFYNCFIIYDKIVVYCRFLLMQIIWLSEYCNTKNFHADIWYICLLRDFPEITINNLVFFVHFSKI